MNNWLRVAAITIALTLSGAAIPARAHAQAEADWCGGVSNSSMLGTVYYCGPVSPGTAYSTSLKNLRSAKAITSVASAGAYVEIKNANMVTTGPRFYFAYANMVFTTQQPAYASARAYCGNSTAGVSTAMGCAWN
ncbi:hypothetical protein AESSP_02696 [Aestuariimicrobium sp. T2.26MG-19.2B]|nr:hypothetical protein AESSP_02696 [Aestuariimicrobium sp. T2.26MG-19.2B]